MLRPGRRVTLNPHPKLGPIIVDLLQAGEEHDAIALVRLATSGVTARVIEDTGDVVVLRVRGSQRRFALPADVVKSAQTKERYDG